MSVRTVAVAVVAGIAAFLVSAVAVIELLLPTMEFSVFVALPAGIFVGSAVTSLVLFAYRGGDDTRRIANAIGAFAATFLVAFGVVLFVVGVGAVVSLLVAIVVGAVGALVVYLRGRGDSA
ncbi:hypothetical protein [Halobellus rufus]|uniref:hypothetical protein n=1 Tax=Halobellus rufus TaxID=1448860 RepID=UPI0006793517|nr:hypothetical protein [Halobellus rufus]